MATPVKICELAPHTQRIAPFLRCKFNECVLADLLEYVHRKVGQFSQVSPGVEKRVVQVD